MRKLFFSGIAICLLLSCGQEFGAHGLAKKLESDFDEHFRRQNRRAADVFAGFLSQDETMEFFRSFAPTEVVWRRKNPAPMRDTAKKYYFTGGYMISADTGRIDFVALICDEWNHSYCNEVAELPDPFDAIRVTEPLVNVPQAFKGFRLVRKLVGNEATDYLMQFDADKFELHWVGLRISIPPSPFFESVEVLTRSEKSFQTYDYRF